MKHQETSIYTIAEDAGVSIATVSRVINQIPSVSEKNRQKVLASIKKFNYIPNISARNLSTSRTTSVGVFVPDISNRYFMQLLRGITKEADELGYNIVLFDTANDVMRERKLLDSARELRLCGIIIAPVSYIGWINIQKMKDLEAFGIPIVLMDRELIVDEFDRVVSTDEEGSFQAVSELIRLGHQKIALISGPETVYNVCKRMNGYYNAMRAAGIMVREEYIRKGDFTVDTAYHEAMILCRLPDPPTAIFSFNYDTTYGCLKAFAELNMRVGEDIALIGFDDIEELEHLHYNITVVSRDAPHMGRLAVRQLSKRITSEETKKETTTSFVETELILRGSERYPMRTV